MGPPSPVVKKRVLVLSPSDPLLRSWTHCLFFESTLYTLELPDLPEVPFYKKHLDSYFPDMSTRMTDGSPIVLLMAPSVPGSGL